MVKTPRTRGTGTLTRNACNLCRTKRAKCDGQTPCRRCHRLGTECAYTTKQWTSKSSLRREVDQLREQLRRKTQILSALVDPATAKRITQLLQQGESIDTIYCYLAGNSDEEDDASEKSSCRCFDHDLQNEPMELPLPNDVAPSFETTETPSTISSVHTPPTYYKDGDLAIEESSEFNDSIGGCLASGLPMRLQPPLDAFTAQTYQPYPSYMAPTMLATNFCDLLGFNGVGTATKDLELA